MDSSCKKNYCSHEVDVKILFETYLSAHAPYSIIKEFTVNVLKTFHKAFSTGKVTGRTVIDCSVGPMFSHLLAVMDFIQEIIIIKLNDGSLKELEKWKNKDPDAFNWAHATEFLQELNENRDELEDEEENLRRKIEKILKWDPSKGDPADVKADIVINIAILEMISKDHDDYRRNLRKMCNVIKPGGYFLSYACTNASYLNVGEDKYHFLPCDESFYRKVISEEGFKIKHVEKFDRVMCTDHIDHEGTMFIIAHKVK